MRLPHSDVWRAQWRSLKQRMQQHDELGNLSMLASFTVSAILAMAVLRLTRGEYSVALLDAVIAAGICAAVLYAWRSGNTARAGMALVGVHSLGCAAVTVLFGHHGLYWIYLVVVTNYFLITPNRAFIAGGMLIALACMRLDTFRDSIEFASFFSTVALVSGFTWLFAQRTAKHRSMLERKATYDALTEVGNRRLMEVELALAAASQARNEAQCAIAMFDLDFFKAVNDNFGHDAGDRVLVQFARIIERHTRQQDRLFRMGGEEFVLLLTATDATRVLRVCEKLRQQVHLELKSPGGALTVSIGAAVLQANEGWSTWLARADAALYAAKRAGRNCTVVASNEALASAAS